MELLVKLKAESDTENIIKYLKKQTVVKSVTLRSNNHKSTKVVVPNKELHETMFRTSSKALDNFFANEPNEKLF